MALLMVGSEGCEIELAAFDKDGTLIDFNLLWGPRSRAAIEALVRSVRGSASLSGDLFVALGYDPETGHVDGRGLLATASLERISAELRRVLERHGLDPRASADAVRRYFAPIAEELPEAEFIRPLANLQRLFSELEAAGVRIAVITSDDRSITLHTLKALGVDRYVQATVCGDDPIPNKPAPDGLWQICRELGVPPERAMMVGDTVTDLLTGEQAGVRCRVGVLSGTGTRAELAPHADVLIPTVGAIEVAG